MPVGIVIVSHSAPLAEALAQLARAVSTGEVPIAVAAGVDDDDDPFGTDATAILAGIESVDDGDGVLVMMDLGSAVLSAELARDLLPEDVQHRVVLCEAPLVEGVVAAAVQVAAGADLADVAAEARSALSAKAAHLGDPTIGGERHDEDSAAEDRGGDGQGGPVATTRLVVSAAHGLHARPAARIVEALAPLDVTATIRNLTTDRPAASATSLNALIMLGVRAGHEVEVRASGPDADRAIEALEALAATDFGDALGDASTTPSATSPEVPDGPDDAGALRGLPAAPGVAIGPVRQLPIPGGAVRLSARSTADRDPPLDPQRERQRLDDALQQAAARLADTERALVARGAGDAAGILEAHRLLLADPAVLDPTRTAIAAGVPAAQAWAAAVTDVLAGYDDIDDPYLAGRAADVDAVGGEVLALLDPSSAGGPQDVDPAGVVVGHDLTPTAAARLDPSAVDAVVTAVGAPTSHAAILARALGIPAVVAAGPGVLDLADGTTVVVDGDRGQVRVDPDEHALATARQQITRNREAAARSRAAGQAPAVTTDGTVVGVLANVGLPQDAARAAAEGADGIGLLRSELLFLDRAAPPDEEEQVAAYDAVCRAIDGRHVVLRTLDIGGDKPVPYVDVAHEDNPFLGDRGIRLTLSRPQLLTTQLRAALRVAADRSLRLMLPMVSGVAEVRAARELLGEARAALEAAGVAAGALQLGVMVEVPSLALVIGSVLPEVDFLSIGTNDLTQYVMAAERGNPAVAHLSDALEPAVLRLIDQVCRAAAATGTPVAVCGGLAADPDAVPVLLGLGVRELSVPPPSIGLIKDRVRRTDLPAAAELATAALDAPDARAVRALLAPA